MERVPKDRFKGYGSILFFGSKVNGRPGDELRVMQTMITMVNGLDNCLSCICQSGLKKGEGLILEVMMTFYIYQIAGFFL